MEKPLFSIVMLVCHNEPKIVDTAKNCLASIRNYSNNYELIVIDNASTEDTSWIDADTIVRFNINRGIAPAWNAGIRMARADYIAIINDDIIVCPEWLDKMKNALSMPNAGVSNLYVEHLPQGVGIVENYKWFSGACFMLPIRTVNRVGYFDEQFTPANFEDHDYWTRIMKSGLKLYVDYSMTIQHKEGQTVHRKEISKYFIENKEKFIKKWGFNSQDVFCGQSSFPFA